MHGFTLKLQLGTVRSPLEDALVTVSDNLPLVFGFHAAGLNHAVVLSKGVLAYSLCA